MVSEDHHNKVKREELRSLIREALPVRNFSNSYLSKRLTLEVTIDNEKDLLLYMDLLLKYPINSDSFEILILISWYYLLTLMLS